LVRTEWPEKYKKKHFQRGDIVDDDDRDFANKQWDAYEQRVDVTKPVNKTTVEMLIYLEIAFEKCKKELNSTDVMSRHEAMDRLKNIRAEYSKAAKDVAQLESQFKLEPQQESLDAVIERTQDIRKDWRNTEIERQMEMRGLFDLVEQFHRTHVRGTEKSEVKTSDLKLPKPKTRKPHDARKNLALYHVRQSEKGESDSDIVVGSNE
jgi:hypothetical protein